MADKRCENGHFIDEAWDICPYCPADRRDAQPAKPRLVRPEPVRRPAEQLSRAAVAPVDVSPPSLQRTVAVRNVDLGAALNRFVVGWLVGISGSLRGESFAIRSGRNVIGREKRSDIVVSDELASTHHADLVYRPEERRFILMDHNSTNGTYVNDEEIEPRRDLLPHDIIRIGSHRFLFVPLCTDEMYWDSEGSLK